MDAPKKRPTLKTVAKLAGVSEATASRALSNHPRHSKKTCERIQKIAQEIGYTRHPFISALMTEIRNKRPATFTPTIALLHCLPKKWFPIPNLTDLKKGAIENAIHQGYKIEEFYLDEPGMTPERMLDVLDARGIRGIIFEHMHDPKKPVNIDVSKFACVAIQYSFIKTKLHQIESDQYSGVLEAVEHALKYGYKRIGLIANRKVEHLIKHKRLASMLLAEKIHAEEAKFFTIETEFTVDHDPSQDIADWIRENGIETILSMRRHIPEELGNVGIEIPQDVGFIHLDMCNDNPNSFSGINANWYQIGQVAANQVIDQLARNEFGAPTHPFITAVPCSWIEGETLPKRTIKENPD